MLSSQLAPFELVYIDQKGSTVPVERNEQRVCFDTFNLLVEHLRDHPNFELADHTRFAVSFELVEGTTTELIGALTYRQSLDQSQMKVTSFKVKGPLPDLSTTGWVIYFPA